MDAPLIRVVLADDHCMVRDGLRAVLQHETDIAIVGLAANGEQAIELTTTLEPDLLLLDICMPGLNGIDTSRKLLKRRPELRIIALSAHNDPLFIRQMAQAGAQGFVNKQQSTDELITAIRQVMAGATYFTIDISPSTAALPIAFSPREKLVLQLLAQGKRSTEIAKTCGISSKTIDTYRSRLLHKLKLESQTELVKYAIMLEGSTAGESTATSESNVNLL